MNGPVGADARTAEIDDRRRRMLMLGYVLDRPLASTLSLMEELGRPLLLEGEPGVGKTEVAKALATIKSTRLIRLQCYEGLDTHHALYEWNYRRQLLSIKLSESAGRADLEENALFSEAYLLRRPLLESLTQSVAPVLLIDEIDRADEAFEAFLLELLSDFQVTIPEIGTIPAVTRPLVILTSNGTRELSDALRRRCLYHYLDFPAFDTEVAIVQARLPESSERLTRQIVEFVHALRSMDLRKKPGIAETLDWAASLVGLGCVSLDELDIEALMSTLSALLKTREDHLSLDGKTLQRLACCS